ncbi:hypothetical protein [Photobacterium sp. DNB22_13_2]
MTQTRLALLGAILFSCTLSAAEITESAQGWALEFSSCSRGRGSAVIQEATDGAVDGVAAAYQSAKNALSSSQERELASLLPELSSLLNAIESNPGRLQTGDSFLQGSETCVAVNLPLSIEAQQGEGDWLWDEAGDELSVRVQATANASDGLSASQAAEFAALQQAVWQGLNLIVDDPSPFIHLQAAPRQFVSEWMVLENHQQGDSATVVVNADLNMAELNRIANNDYLAAGEPVFLVHAEQPRFAEPLIALLIQQGYQITQSFDSADIVLRVTTELRTAGDRSQLALSLSLLDKASARLGEWQNEPAVVALPTKEGIETRLFGVHLASEDNQHSIVTMLQSGLMQLSQAGGRYNKIVFPKNTLASQAQLQRLLGQHHYIYSPQLLTDGEQTVLAFRSRMANNSLMDTLIPELLAILDNKVAVNAVSNNQIIIR